MRKLHIFLFVVLMLFFFNCGCQNTLDDTITKNTSAPQLDVSNVPLEYQAILADYSNLIKFRISDNFEEDYNNGTMITLKSSLNNLLHDETDLSKHWYDMFVEMTEGKKFLFENDFSFLLKDLNNDAFPELLWNRSDGAVLAVFSAYDGEAYLIDAFWTRHTCRVAENSKLYIISNGGANYTDYEIKFLDKTGKELITEMMFGFDGLDLETGRIICYEKIDKKKVRITAERLEQLLITFMADN